MSEQSKNGLRIAVEGCAHGTLHAIYASVQKSCEAKGWDGVDLLIIGGDFQAVRNAQDLSVVSMPAKYREIGDFHEYYSGARTAPYLTIFVGGNHEASNYLFELYYGGWVAANIYYMGAANILRLGPLRIAGLSGIWKGYNYRKPHFERLPYSPDDIKSIYHVRELDVRKLLQIRTQVDIGISHDWPRDVVWKGDYKWLFRRKDLFEADAKEGKLGSVAARLVMDRLRPPYWFSAHLHVKYSALVGHSREPGGERTIRSETRTSPLNGALTSSIPIMNKEEIDLDEEDASVGPPAEGKALVGRNTDEIDLDLDDEPAGPIVPSHALPARNTHEIDLEMDDDGKTGASLGETSKESQERAVIPPYLREQLPAAFHRPSTPPSDPKPLPTDIRNETTRFLALDKCLPRRDFLQLMEVEPMQASPLAKRPRLEYDKEWLAITRVFASELVFGDPEMGIPHEYGEAHYRPLIEKEEKWVEDNIVSKGMLEIPYNFQITAPVYDQSQKLDLAGQPREYPNNQTAEFCTMLEIPNSFHLTEAALAERSSIIASVSENSWPSRRHNGHRGSRGGRGTRGRSGGRGGHGRGRGRGRGSWS